MTINKQALREIAAAAVGAHERLSVMPPDDIFDISLAEGTQLDADITALNALNSAANPTTVLALLNEIAELEQRHCGTALLEREEMHTKTLGRMLDELDAKDKRIAELEAKLDSADKLQDSAFRHGLQHGFSLGQTDNQAGFEECLSAYGTGKGE